MFKINTQKIKYFASGIIIGSLLSSTVAFADNPVRLFINNKEINAEAILINDRTYVPLRVIAETLNCIVDWDGASNSVIINNNTSSSDISNNTTTTEINKTPKLPQDVLLTLTPGDRKVNPTYYICRSYLKQFDNVKFYKKSDYYVKDDYITDEFGNKYYNVPDQGSAVYMRKEGNSTIYANLHL